MLKATYINVDGKASIKSATRPIALSYFPPIKPAEIPRKSPTATKAILVMNAIENEMRDPYESSPKRSRPTPGSIPNG